MPRCHPWTARDISASGGRRRAMDSPSFEFPWTGGAKPGRRCHCRRSHGSSRGSSFAIRAGGISHLYIEITRYVLAAVRAGSPCSISLPTHGPRFHFPHRGRQKKSQSQSRTKRRASGLSALTQRKPKWHPRTAASEFKIRARTLPVGYRYMAGGAGRIGPPGSGDDEEHGRTCSRTRFSTYRSRRRIQGREPVGSALQGA